MMTGTEIHTNSQDSPSAIEKEIQFLWPGFHHRILGQIGVGGCGRAVKIRWTATGQPAVLKYLLSAVQPAVTEDSKFQNLTHGQWKKFLEQEARIMVNFKEFDAAIDVLDLHSNFQAFIMDYIPAGSLLDAISQPSESPFTESLDWQEKIRRFLPVVDLLAALQQEGIYHRDITLDNILITRSGSLKLADFGLAHHIYEPIVEAIPGGKPGYRYIEPERLRGKERLRNDLQDVYSCVICLLGWIKEHDPNDLVSPLQTLVEDCPADLLHAIKPIIMPSGEPPSFSRDSGSFSLLANNLRRVIRETRTITTSISYLSKEATYASFIEARKGLQPAQAVYMEEPPPSLYDSLSWLEEETFEYAFPNIETVTRFKETQTNWPNGLATELAACVYASSMTAQISWEQAALFASQLGFHLPNREQAKHIQLPNPILQFWLREKKTESLALIGPGLGGTERFEPVNSASPFRILCVIRPKRESK
ncbi:MAG: hypothetical protein CSA81_04770 [Acidobacteria bacterium]|nr:MAG: hypothetical protein CSA81_04770 [Acidobacteriota bacterium]